MRVEHYIYEDPKGFTEAEELILYLPNTPKEEVPNGAIKQIRNFSTLTESDYLDQFILYNPAEDAFFLIGEGGLVDTEVPSEDEMQEWYGKYWILGGEMNMHYDDTLSCVTATFISEDGEEYQLFVERVKDEPGCVMIYGASERGASLVFLLWGFDDWYDVYFIAASGASVRNYPDRTTAVKV